MLRIFLLAIFLILTPMAAAGGDSIGICYRKDAAPFSYVSTVGIPTGYSVELCKRVAKKLGRNPKMVEVTAEDRFDSLRSKICDILCEASTVTMKRRKIMEFSLITFVTGSALLYPVDLVSIKLTRKVVKVGYVRGTTVAEKKNAGKFEGKDINFEFYSFNNHTEATQALLAGNVDGYIADREFIEQMLKNEPALAGTHRLSSESLTYEPYAIAVRLGDDDLRIAIDTVLADLFRTNEIDVILTEHIPQRRRDPILRRLFQLQSLPE